MKLLFWWWFWIFTLLILVAGLDNLFFQPPMPGWIIAAMCFSSLTYMFCGVRPFRKR